MRILLINITDEAYEELDVTVYNTDGQMHDPPRSIITRWNSSYKQRKDCLTSNGVGLVCTIFLVWLRDRMGWNLNLKENN